MSTDQYKTIYFVYWDIKIFRRVFKLQKTTIKDFLLYVNLEISFILIFINNPAQFSYIISIVIIYTKNQV